MSEQKEKTREEAIVDFLKAWVALDEAIKPFREQKLDLKHSYIENGWLDKDDIKLISRAYRFLKDNSDLDDFNEIVKEIQSKIGDLS